MSRIEVHPFTPCSGHCNDCGYEWALKPHPDETCTSCQIVDINWALRHPSKAQLWDELLEEEKEETADYLVRRRLALYEFRESYPHITKEDEHAEDNETASAASA